MSEVQPERTARFHVFRRWVLGVLILAAASAAAWILAVYAQLPWLASYVLAAAVGWVLYRLVRASTVGIALWCLAVVATGTAYWGPWGAEADGAQALCGTLGFLFFIASTIVFLVVAIKDRSRWVRNWACCNLALFTLIAWVSGCATVRRDVSHREDVEHTTETIIKLHKLAADIESFRSRRGRLPRDEEELTAFRGQPMPTFHDQYRISYQSDDNEHYNLACTLSGFWGHAWDMFGWIVQYNGPDSPRRVEVILF